MGLVKIKVNHFIFRFQLFGFLEMLYNGLNLRDRVDTMTQLLKVFFIYIGGTALYGLVPEDVVNIMNGHSSEGEFIIWQSMTFDRGLICLGFAITWLFVIPWHIKKKEEHQNFLIYELHLLDLLLLLRRDEVFFQDL